MLPGDLTAAAFRGYPPRAREIATGEIDLLRLLPIGLLGLLLRELRGYDVKFPEEQREVDVQIRYLRSLPTDALGRAMAGFASLSVPAEISDLNWVDLPEIFSQRFSAMLWATGQIAAFRSASIQYVDAYRAAFPADPPPVSRLVIVSVGRGAEGGTYPLFRRLRPYGVHYTDVKTGGDTAEVLKLLTTRSRTYPAPFAHWYVDGGAPAEMAEPGVMGVSYARLNPLRLAVLKRMRAVGGAAGGPEGLQVAMRDLQPEQFGITGYSQSDLLRRFELSLFTEGSGTQIYSTSFVQWTVHEVLRRAQPLTVFARYAPRQTERSLDELLADEGAPPVLDAQGSLIDADMGAYSMWLGQRRLGDAKESAFLAWCEDSRQALLIAPGAQPGSISAKPIGFDGLLAQLS